MNILKYIDNIGRLESEKYLITVNGNECSRSGRSYDEQIETEKPIEKGYI